MSSLLDDLFVIAYDTEHKGGVKNLAGGVGSAVLLDLTFAGRVGFGGGRLVITSGALGDPFLDGVIASLAAEGPATAEGAIAHIGRVHLMHALEAVEARGRLRRVGEMGAGDFTIPKLELADRATLSQARSRLRTAVDAGRALDARTAALAVLVHAARAEKRALPDRKPRQTRKALEAIGSGAWAAGGESEAVGQVLAPVLAAVMSAPRVPVPRAPLTSI